MQFILNEMMVLVPVAVLNFKFCPENKQWDHTFKMKSFMQKVNNYVQNGI